MATKKIDLPKLTRRSMALSCTQCKRSITVMAFEDSEAADGWPLHRCGREIRPFDTCEVL